MRILTVRQPWAWAIVAGGKDVENRTTNVAGSYLGPVAIHAALQWDDTVTWNSSWETLLAAMKVDGSDPFDAPWQIHRGAIIGMADLVDVHRSRPTVSLERTGPVCVGAGAGIGNLCSAWAEEFSAPGGFHLVFENPRQLEEPIPFRGMLGLRELDAAIALDVRLRAA